MRTAEPGVLAWGAGSDVAIWVRFAGEDPLHPLGRAEADPYSGSRLGLPTLTTVEVDPPYCTLTSTVALFPMD
jgi:hypothetical protein